MKYLSLFFALVLSAVCLVAQDEPAEEAVVFKAVLDMGEQAAFSLSTSGGAQGRWVKAGQTFQGYTVARYDREARTLYLVDEAGEELAVQLSASSFTPEDGMALAKAEEIMRLSNFQKMMKDSLAIQRDAIVQNMASRLPTGIDAQEMAQFQAKIFDTMVEGIDWEAIETSMTQVYSEVFTPAELNGFIDFYGTPAGQASIEKMPELQQKSMQAMMPQMMQVMPKLQQLAQEFARKQQAKQRGGQ